MAVAIVCGAEPAWRVAGRFDDGDRGARMLPLSGDGGSLTWAPAGPGWTRQGAVTWQQARRIAAHLSEDGAELLEEPIGVWRLPTREEAVRSLTRGNRNACGVFAKDRAPYEVTPDKESPLWDPFAPLIYLSTADEADADRAWIVVYHGGLFTKPKAMGSPSAGLRAVRDPPADEDETR
ncbi:MAG: hypothetical protein AAGJ46_10230 [Planctomycetota bacterium]